MADLTEGTPGVITAEQLFDSLWRELVDVLGTAAAATLLRRAAKRAGVRHDELREFQVLREDWAYRYVLPPSWGLRSAAEVAAVLDLIGVELVPLLREFTGEIVVRRLERNPAFGQLRLRT